MSITLDNLPAISTARLPRVYESARNALTKCSRIDECKEWANKAEALASYAKQAKDESLRKMADRIQARAIRRCGELYKQIPPSKGGRPRNELCKHGEPYGGAECQHCKRTKTGTGARTSSRKQAAQMAGMSKWQKDTALRVANVSEKDFERQVESDNPPTVTALAEQGTARHLKGRSPDDFKAATRALGALRRFCEFADKCEPDTAVRGLDESERIEARAMVKKADNWLDRFVIQIGG